MMPMSTLSSIPTADHTVSHPPTANCANPGPATTPEISSLRLLGDQGLLRIEHRGAVYTLRATSKGGLILTK